MTIDAANGVARAQQTEISYPIRDGIIDLLPEAGDRVSKAYDAYAACYDAYMTGSGLHWKLYSLVLFGFIDATDLLLKPLSSIPSDFDGVLLDVPVGTGFFTAERYRTLTTATIVAVDCSLKMLRQAQRHYTENNIRNVVLVRADVGNLPIHQGSIDACLSMAGFHAFPKKDRALHEIARVLKRNGLFSGTLYIKGKWFLTDLLVSQVFCRMGFFTGPFLSEQQCVAKFGKYFNVHYVGSKRSGFYFSLLRNTTPVDANDGLY